MAKRSQQSGKGPAPGKRQAPAVNAKQAGNNPAEEDWTDLEEAGSEDDWTELSVRERDSSRIRRQMEARRKLEQLTEAKRLSSLVDDWTFGDDWALNEERG